MAVVKVSAPMAIKHANGITFNSRKNIIVVANSTPKPKRLTVINPDSLTIMYHKTLSVKKGVSGLTKKQKKKFKGVGAIAYNEKHDCYICYMRTNHNLLYLDGNLKPYKSVKQNARTSLLFQGMDSYDDCIMVCQSFKGKKKYNTITVYDMNGRYIAKFTSPKGNGQELETVFHDGDQFYAGFYRFYGAKKDSQKKKVKRINYVYKVNNLKK